MTLQETAPPPVAIPEDGYVVNASIQAVAVPAPTDMEAGYTFDAVHEGQIIKVVVPEGGVTKDQLILVNVDKDNERPDEHQAAKQEEETLSVEKGEHVDEHDSRNRLTDGVPIPTGHFRDELCDCCNRGCCEPQCCLAFWCPTILLAQIMTRMRMNAVAQVQSTPQPKTFAIVVGIFAVSIILDILRSGLRLDTGVVCNSYYGCFEVVQARTSPLIAFLSVVLTAFGIYFLVIGTLTRMGMRERFNIHGSGFGDCCTYCWCAWCATTQMARHTHDPNAYHVSCCTSNGLRDDAPDIIV
jgi:Cys-rich protein (TIGR01571 family)